MNAARRDHQLQTLGRFLSMLLRHRPARFPIELDAQGYADLGQVMRILKALPNFRWASRRDIQAVLDLEGAERFELVATPDGDRIRALYGHTALRLEHEPVEPPPILYYAAAPESAAMILRTGITARERAYVRLMLTATEARCAALRLAAEPVVFRIDAAAAYAAGIPFYAPTEGVTLVEYLPPKYLRRLA